MSRIWRIVLFLALGLVIVGVVLLGAAWLTGASIPRIVELVFGGQAELEAWYRTALERGYALWTALRDSIIALF